MAYENPVRIRYATGPTPIQFGAMPKSPASTGASTAGAVAVSDV